MCHPIILKAFGVKEWTISDVDHAPQKTETLLKVLPSSLQGRFCNVSKTYDFHRKD